MRAKTIDAVLAKSYRRAVSEQKLEISISEETAEFLAELLHYQFVPLSRKLERIERKLEKVFRKEQQIMSLETDLQEAVQAITDEEASMEARLDAIIIALKANPSQQAVRDAVTQLQAERARLGGYSGPPEGSTPTLK